MSLRRVTTYDCPVCGTEVQADNRSSRVKCHECGYHIKEPEPDMEVYGYE